MDQYSGLDNEELVAKAISAHRNHYEIEAFTIIFESINYYLTGALYYKHEKNAYSKSYFQLTNIADKKNIFPYKMILNLHLFRFYRNTVVHSMLYDEFLEQEHVDMWFIRGRKLNARIQDYYYEFFSDHPDSDGLDKVDLSILENGFFP